MKSLLYAVQYDPGPESHHINKERENKCDNDEWERKINKPKCNDYAIFYVATTRDFPMFL